MLAARVGLASGRRLTLSTQSSLLRARAPQCIARRQLCSASSSSFSAEQQVLWPVAAGAACIGGVFIGSLWLRQDSSINRVHGWLRKITKAGMTADTVTTPWCASAFLLPVLLSLLH